jgi:hypothetical protein
MYVPRLLILLLAVSVSPAAQVSGQRQVGNVYECVVEPETVQRPWKNPFPTCFWPEHNEPDAHCSSTGISDTRFHDGECATSPPIRQPVSHS